MNIIAEYSEGLWSASTNDYVGTFYGYGETKEDAIEDLKAEVEFYLKGGYSKVKEQNNE